MPFVWVFLHRLNVPTYNYLDQDVNMKSDSWKGQFNGKLYYMNVNFQFVQN